MKSSIIFAAFLSGMAIANPVVKRQELDIDAYEAVPDAPVLSVPFGDDSDITTTTTYNPTAAASSAISAATADVTNLANATVVKRQTPPGCTINVVSNYAGTVTPNTDAAFEADPTIAEIANSAIPPPGYFLVDGFQNLKAAASDVSYKTYTSSSISSYNVNTCATRCTAMAGCQSFNIFFERDNTYVSNLASCPASGTDTSILIKCAFFGAPLKVSMATNIGQFKNTGYHVVIAGSNAYTTTPQSLPGYDGPYPVGDASINAPPGPYMGVKTFTGSQPYDPSVCAAACNAITAALAAHPIPGQPAACVFFDAYIMYANGANGQFTCTYYGEAFDSTYATNFGQTRGGVVYTVGHSYTYKIAGTPFQPSK